MAVSGKGPAGRLRQVQLRSRALETLHPVTAALCRARRWGSRWHRPGGGAGVLGKHACVQGRKPHQLTTDEQRFPEKPPLRLSTDYKTWGDCGRCWSREGGLEPEIKLSAQQNTSGDKEAASLGL